MALVLILLAVLLILAVLLFTVASEINFNFNSDNQDMKLTMHWLHPLLKSIVVRKDSIFVMTIYLFDKKMLEKQINRKQNARGNRNIINSLNPTDIHVYTQYGFRDPFVTGFACSAITMLAGFFKVESLRLIPDFLASDDYIRLNATAKLNLGHSLMKLI